MFRHLATASGLLLVMITGCRDNRPMLPEQSASARAQCEREAQTTEPPGARGTLVGAFETTVKAVVAEYRRLYSEDWPGLGNPSDDTLVLCYYDVPQEQTALSPPGSAGPIERISIVVDAQLNGGFLHGGPKTVIPVKGLR